VEAADLAAGLDLQTKTPPELGIMSKYGVNNFDCDRSAAWRPAKEHLAHPAGPKTTRQEIISDLRRVICPKSIHGKVIHYRGELAMALPAGLVRH
jgi:hypothetical protein